MPKRFPPEFKHDVVAVARRPDSVLAEVCVDFDISKSTLQRWMRQADIDDGVHEGLTTAEQDELVRCAAERAGWRWRTRSSAGRPGTSQRTRSQRADARWSVTLPPRGSPWW